MAAADLAPLGRLLHLAAGFGAVALGLVVMLAPKFGARAAWHRRLGRAYAILIAGSCVLGVMLAYRRDNTYLVILGAVTLAVVLAGWRDGRAARALFAGGSVPAGKARLRRHLVLMAASYVGAWSGFFATNPVFGTDGEWLVWLYVFGPSLVAAPLIARAARRLG